MVEIIISFQAQLQYSSSVISCTLGYYSVSDSHSEATVPDRTPPAFQPPSGIDIRPACIYELLWCGRLENRYSALLSQSHRGCPTKFKINLSQIAKNAYLKKLRA